jgi:hypothetical protein
MSVSLQPALELVHRLGHVGLGPGEGEAHPGMAPRPVEIEAGVAATPASASIRRAKSIESLEKRRTDA